MYCTGFSGTKLIPMYKAAFKIVCRTEISSLFSSGRRTGQSSSTRPSYHSRIAYLELQYIRNSSSNVTSLLSQLHGICASVISLFCQIQRTLKNPKNICFLPPCTIPVLNSTSQRNLNCQELFQPYINLFNGVHQSVFSHFTIVTKTDYINSGILVCKQKSPGCAPAFINL